METASGLSSSVVGGDGDVLNEKVVRSGTEKQNRGRTKNGGKSEM